MDVYEAQIIAQAKRDIETLISAVVTRLARLGGILDDLANNGNWPFASPFTKAKFLEQLFWAKHEFEFFQWRESFKNEVAKECKDVIQEGRLRQTLAFDFISTACCIENGPSKLCEIEGWAIHHLSELAWAALMESDMSLVDYLGIIIRPKISDDKNDARRSAVDQDGTIHCKAKAIVHPSPSAMLDVEGIAVVGSDFQKCITNTDPKFDKQMEYWAACHSAIITWAKPHFDIIAKQTIEKLKK